MRFRAHETFAIRKGWLHKGMKNIVNSPNVFIDKDVNPMEKLGLGTNMVKALRYWLQVAGLTYENQKTRMQFLTRFGKLVWENDKYIEEDGTLYLIHYFLSSNKEMGTSWYYFFNHYNATEFTKEAYLESMKLFLYDQEKENYGKEIKFSERALLEDLDCILRTYLPSQTKYSPESNMDSPFLDLQLLKVIDAKEKVYSKNSPLSLVINPLIILAIIVNEKEKLEEKEGTKVPDIKISTLESAPNNIGRIFNLNNLTVAMYLDRLQNMGYVKVVRTAGLDIVKINEELTFIDVVEKYYKSII